jgi:hypothetical protein
MNNRFPVETNKQADSLSIVAFYALSLCPRLRTSLIVAENLFKPKAD